MLDRNQSFDDLYPALDSLHPTVPIVGKQPYEQVFTSPGTWTRPANVTWVDVVVVGGGGGGSGAATGQTVGGAGGGGVNRAFAPVSAPVPVTVGAGGTAGTPAPPIGSATPGNVGGTSAFGPLGPGPVPAIPPTTVAAGGGGGSHISPGGTGVPSIGGGLGVNTSLAPAQRGIYGTIWTSQYGGGALEIGGNDFVGFNAPGLTGSSNGSKGKYGYGGGGARIDLSYFSGPTPITLMGIGAVDGGANPGSNAVANRGGGGGGGPSGTGGPGFNGGSGIVIVRWWE